jgi:hypothetical protein
VSNDKSPSALAPRFVACGLLVIVSVDVEPLFSLRPLGSPFSGMMRFLIEGFGNVKAEATSVCQNA